MSDDTVDPPLPSNDNNQRQIRNGGRLLVPLGNLIRLPRTPFPPFHAGRILIFQNQTDIISSLSAMSSTLNQPIYILRGTGYVSQANLTTLPSLQQVTVIGCGEILYMSGWVQPVMQSGGHVGVPSSCANGVVHVSISGAVQQNVSMATSLYAFGIVRVCVTFVCGPESRIEPGPLEPISIILPAPAPPQL